MAYTVTAYGSNNRSPQYKEYEIDTPDDLDTLPVQAEITAIGSLAHSRSNNTTYKLGNNREWYALSEGGGSGLPESTAEDAGKVLTVGSTGAAEWNTNPFLPLSIVADTTDPQNPFLRLDGITFAEIESAISAAPYPIPVISIPDVVSERIIGRFESEPFTENTVLISAYSVDVVLSPDPLQPIMAMGMALYSITINPDNTVAILQDSVSLPVDA